MVFITSQSLNAEILRQQNLARDIATEQTKISTGKKINQPVRRSVGLGADFPDRPSAIDQRCLDVERDLCQCKGAAAATSLGDVNSLMSKVTELLVQSTSTSQDSPGREAVAKSIEGIKQSIHDLLYQTDYQGSPVFDDTHTVNIPVGCRPCRGRRRDATERHRQRRRHAVP